MDTPATIHAELAPDVAMALLTLVRTELDRKRRMLQTLEGPNNALRWVLGREISQLTRAKEALAA